MRQGKAAARPYAKALFALAQERSLTDQIARDLEALLEVVRTPELEEFFGLPWVSAAAKRAAAGEVATRAGVSPLARDFLILVSGQGRADHLEAIAAGYRELLDLSRGVVRARVRTAVALGEEERAALSTRLGQALDGKRVLLEESVDPELLGGFVAEIGSVIVDGSLDGQLARLRERLVKG